ncbi:SIS domain-containing protein [Aeromicrobium tamlense]|uniref:D-sedoheptulose 7-phosphate isomerase n=1 Tax=Aeromicrobium tamlense TaxID=375541 RepID=A0A8I0FUN9_9ACTN|nr:MULTISPECIES: SIS domain-containing protein [Aeromicrobium]MBD1270945.1 SIS domain-containing protein [Aeromicrobium tamlense]NYI38337.1 D-sedoheptulose 7-phosphate isomerase [Aeromicrobium tamlense]
MEGTELTIEHQLHRVSDDAVAQVVAQRQTLGIDAWATLARALEEPALVEAVDAAGRAVVETLRAGGTILVAGNGGSAAIASHVAAEFVGKCILDRAPLPAVCLADSLTSITAVGNDYGFDDVFVRGVQSMGRPGDLLIAMSTSGRSESILRALDAARERGIATVALTGEGGGDLPGRADHVLHVPSDFTPRIQEVHMLWAHAWCEAVDVLSQPTS